MKDFKGIILKSQQNSGLFLPYLKPVKVTDLEKILRVV